MRLTMVRAKPFRGMEETQTWLIKGAGLAMWCDRTGRCTTLLARMDEAEPNNQTLFVRCPGNKTVSDRSDSVTIIMR